jgi:hypothetical protein
MYRGSGSLTLIGRSTSMAPEITWSQILDSLAAGDWDKADHYARHLLAWLDSGGAPPLTVGPPELGSAWHRDVAAHVALLALARARSGRQQNDRSQVSSLLS